ncbi:hypothetical protein K435DRAFT_685681, partial [Dendrothele bispora CBS 962.96]
YTNFLLHWIDFERLHDWEKSGGRLEAVERPTEVTEWINNGRYLPRCKGPNVRGNFLEQFPKKLHRWWAVLQSSTPLNHNSPGNCWTALDKYGINGWFSIVVCVKWWGEGLKSITGNDLRLGTEKWLAMVRELTEALEALKRHLEKTEG